MQYICNIKKIIDSVPRWIQEICKQNIHESTHPNSPLFSTRTFAAFFT